MAQTDRKSEHLRIASAPGVEHSGATGLGSVRLRHRALPERALSDVSLNTLLLGRRLAAPLIVSAMTGGTAQARDVNRGLMRAAAEHGIGLVLGSGRRLLDDPGLLRTYRPEHSERPPLLLANLGGHQVRDASAPAQAERLVELLDADGLSIHLNPL